ncbi:MAG TPA: hypothetical protein VF553_21630 [Pyrinomonadaceae bacterium]|jgi:hypothetical protein
MSRVVCQFGLPRSGLYAAADWYKDGVGGDWQHSKGAGLGQISADGSARRFFTLETLFIKEVKQGLRLCRELGATAWVQLRDPYNWSSSLHQGVMEKAVAWRPPQPLERWKEYARYCLENDGWLNYNRWFGDQDYRRELAERFGFRRHRNGEPWQHVPDRGGGSSFDKERYKGRAQEMAILLRYTRFVVEPWWRVQFDDEVIALAEQLFGIKRPW